MVRSHSKKKNSADSRIELRRQIGNRIRGIRAERNITQQDLATKLGITAGAYAKIERGEVDPSITRLFELSQLLEVDIIHLIKGQPALAPSPDMLLATHLTTLQTELSKLQGTVKALQKTKK